MSISEVYPNSVSKDYKGRNMTRNLIANKLGTSIQLEMSLCSSRKVTLHICTCRREKNDWTKSQLNSYAIYQSIVFDIHVTLINNKYIKHTKVSSRQNECTENYWRGETELWRSLKNLSIGGQRQSLWDVLNTNQNHNICARGTFDPQASPLMKFTAEI